MTAVKTAPPASTADVASQPVTPTKPRLTDEQLASLRSCASGISLRFEKPEIVKALLAGGYVDRNVAGVVKVTPKGEHYLLAHTS